MVIQHYFKNGPEPERGDSQGFYLFDEISAM